MPALWQRATTGTGEGSATRMRSVDFKSICAFSLTAVLAAICAWPSSALAGAPCRNANLRPTRANVAAIDSATVCLIDGVRSAAHLRALHANGSLRRVAARQSREMVLGDYFGDDSRSGETPLQRIVATRYLRHAARVSTAQNIGWGTDGQATPAAIVAAWMSSPPHREIVLTEEFRDVGVGAVPAAPTALAAGRPGATYTVEFGTRR